MDHDPKETPRTANVVGIGANLVCDPDDRKRTRYPVEWKECCRDIFNEYRRYKSETEGGEYSWTRIRNQIMRKHDVYEGTRIVEESTLLSRQNLESFVKHGKMLNDDKFKFLDHFIHKNLLDPNSDFSIAAERVIAYREKLQQECFHVLYLGDRRAVDKEVYTIADEFCGRFYAVEEPASAEENLRTALYIKPYEQGRYQVIGYYFKFTPQSVSEILEYGYRYFGYLQMLTFADQLQGSRIVYGLLKLFDRSLYATKEAIYHSTSHCFMTAGGSDLKLAGVDEVTHPFRAVTQQTEEKSAIRETMAMTIPTLYPSYQLQAKYLAEMELSPEQKVHLDNVHDEYLLW